ncbi:MAG: D-alanyl-D-alanine carboxypeptidase [Deltaproteobacteria bacterium]|nr:D-alanyl-D-alanine carboxypeptidase [Deltaproteobacteria bacterium]
MKRWRMMLVIGALCGLSAGVRQAEARKAARQPAEKAAAPAANVDLYRSAILMDAESGTVLFEKNAHQVGPPASMTKMMLMLLVAERVRDGSLRWDDPITTSAWASNIGGSQVYLKEGEVFSLAEMMQAITIHSANDASVAVAEAVAGSSDAFVDLMNERAKELGMRDTVYHSVHGLPPAPGQQSDMSSAFDMATLAREVVKLPDIMKWSGTKETTFRNGTLTLTNTNRLVRETGWVDGLKTGFYREAGFNVTATARRDGLRLISVIMGAPQKRDCFAQAAALLNKGFGEYKALLAVKKGDTVANDVAVRGGKAHFVRVIAGADVAVLAKRADKKKFLLELALPGEVQAPLPVNAQVGQVVVKDGDTVIGKVPALAADPVEKQTSLWDRLF